MPAAICFLVALILALRAWLLGRLFDYGDVKIHGTGTTYEPLRAVDRPIALMRQ
jgi:hypothetical protein